MNNKEHRTQEDFRQQLKEQLIFLQTSVDIYDNGSEIEVKRMAATLRILLHDTSRSTSLLSSLNRKDIPFVDTASEDITNVITSYCGLAFKILGAGKPRYIAPLDEAPVKFRDFETWWNGVVLKDMDGHQLSRRDVILTMANQDGGSHVDPMIDQPYQRIKTGESVGHMWSDGNKWINMHGAEIATVRQIAHEVLKSLKPQYTKKAKRPPSSIVIDGFSLKFSENPKDASKATEKK
jgi:hypothetical protein